MLNNVTVTDTRTTYLTSELQEGWLVRDIEGDIYIMSEDFLVRLGDGLVIKNPARYEPYTRVYRVIVESTR